MSQLSRPKQTTSIVKILLERVAQMQMANIPYQQIDQPDPVDFSGKPVVDVVRADRSIGCFPRAPQPNSETTISQTTPESKSSFSNN